MATKRQIEAYEKRLAKIDQSDGLTAECIGAVVTIWRGFESSEVVEGTLTAFTHRLGFGMFGERVITDVVLCTACAHQKGNCDDPGAKVALKDVLFRSIERNTDRRAG